MERAPTILPPRFDESRRHTSEHFPNPSLARRIRVQAKLDLVVCIGFLETAGCQREQSRASDLHVRQRDAHADA